MTTPLIFADPLGMKAGLEERAFVHFVLSQDDRLRMVGTNSSRSEVRVQDQAPRAKTNKASQSGSRCPVGALRLGLAHVSQNGMTGYERWPAPFLGSWGG